MEIESELRKILERNNQDIKTDCQPVIDTFLREGRAKNLDG